MISALLQLAALEAALLVAAWVLANRRAPVALLGLLVATAPLEVYRTPVLGVNVSLFRLSILVAVMFLLKGFGGELRRIAREPVVWCYVALALVMALSLASISDNTGLGFRMFGQAVIGTATIVVVAAFARQIAEVSLVATTIVAAAGLPILAACWHAIAYSAAGDPTLPFLHGLPVASGLESSRTLSFVGSSLRAKATFADPNHLGAYAALTLGPCLGLLADGVRRRSVVRGCSAAAMGVALVCLLLASGSRSAWLAACVSAGGVAAVLGLPALLSLGWRTRVTTGAAVLASCLLIAAVVAPIVGHRLNDAPANAVSNRSHANTLRHAVDDFRDHPAFGIGLADFGQQLSQGPRTSGAHSTYLTVGAELGALGLLVLVMGLAATGALLVNATRSADRRSRDIVVGVASGYAGFAAASAVYDLWWDDFHWVAIGCIVGLFGYRGRTRPLASDALSAELRVPVADRTSRAAAVID